MITSVHYITPLFISLRMIDIIDILLVALLLYVVFKLIRKTVAMNIFIGILAIYIIWKLVTVFQMELLSDILGQFISVGVIALLIVFQQELRKFLLLLGTPKFLPEPLTRFFSFGQRGEQTVKARTEILIDAVSKLSEEKMGALIILARDNKLPDMVNTGIEINGQLSVDLIRSIFFKNNPLHDGAVVIDGGRIRAARCILPVSGNKEIPAHYGLRHRAGIGITEQSDAIAVIVSEETGHCSYAIRGKLRHNVKQAELRRVLPVELMR
jgi:diadenylate cyclase